MNAKLCDFSLRRTIESRANKKFRHRKVGAFPVGSHGKYLAFVHIVSPVSFANFIYSFFFQREFNIPRRAAKAAHRKSFITTTSPTLPRCHSPLSGT